VLHGRAAAEEHGAARGQSALISLSRVLSLPVTFEM
jgi:hypothetical protein